MHARLTAGAPRSAHVGARRAHGPRGAARRVGRGAVGLPRAGRAGAVGGRVAVAHHGLPRRAVRARGARCGRAPVVVPGAAAAGDGRGGVARAVLARAARGAHRRHGAGARRGLHRARGAHAVREAHGEVGHGGVGPSRAVHADLVHRVGRSVAHVAARHAGLPRGAARRVVGDAEAAATAARAHAVRARAAFFGFVLPGHAGGPRGAAGSVLHDAEAAVGARAAHAVRRGAPHGADGLARHAGGPCAAAGCVRGAAVAAQRARGAGAVGGRVTLGGDVAAGRTGGARSAGRRRVAVVVPGAVAVVARDGRHRAAGAVLTWVAVRAHGRRHHGGGGGLHRARRARAHGHARGLVGPDVYVPLAHVPHARSFMVLPGTVTYSPATHVL
jgi:hypothetical protein